MANTLDSLNAEPAPAPAELVEFIKKELAEAERALKCRVEARVCWSKGTNESWAKVGCQLSKAARLKVSAREGHIAIRLARKVEMLKGVLSILTAAAATTSNPA